MDRAAAAPPLLGAGRARAGATSSSSTTCAPGAGSRQRREGAEHGERPLCRAALPLGLLLPRRRLAAGRARRSARRSSATRALALTDHDSASGARWSSPTAARASGCGDHGAEIDVAPESRGLAAPRPPPDAAGRDARGWRNLCRIITPPTPTPRDGQREPGEPRSALEAVLEHAEGLVCLTGCAAARRRTTSRRARAAARRLRAASACGSSCSAPTRGTTAPATGRWPRSRARLGVRCVATGDVHAHARSRAELQDAFVALRHALHARGLRAAAARQPQPRAASPEAMARASPIIPRRCAETLQPGRALSFDLTRRPRLPLPGRRGRRRRRARLTELCRARLWRSATPGRRRRERRAGRGARLERGAAR